MSIGFRMQTPEEVRARLEKMSDAQLIEHRKTLRDFCKPTPGRGTDKGWLMQLNEARAEWKRRHPPKKFIQKCAIASEECSQEEWLMLLTGWGPKSGE